MVNIHQVRADVRNIVRELRNIEFNVRHDFNGIGQDMCANCIKAVADHYEFRVLRALNNMNQNLISTLLHKN